ncbi:MAG: ABC transporter permease [Muribaculaceae bacterium]|nr:ABC transporter permease [Muribaculaceae bacterium]
MLALRIAWRYLFAPKSHKAVNVISVIALAGVAVATMAIVVVLSVFNGFAELSRSHLSKVDPDIRIEAVRGKVFGSADSLCRAVAAMPGVAAVQPVLVERALAVAGSEQMPVVVKGVTGDAYRDVVPVGETVIDGVFIAGPLPPDSASAAVLAVGPAMQLRVRPGLGSFVDLYVPRRRGRINPANPAGAYRRAAVTVAGVMQIDQPEYDNDFIITDIALMRSLLDYDSDTAGALEVRLTDGTDASRAAAGIAAALGADFDVLTRERQQAETFRMIAVEKWVTFLMLVFILVIASFNIITTLSLLVIEKRDNMRTMRALGAPHSLVASVFAWEGALITALGGIVGVVLGVLLSWIQQHFGIIRLGADPSALTIDVYPVRIEGADILAVSLTVIVLGLAIGQLARLFTRKID